MTIDVELSVALISAVVAMASALFSFYSQRQIALLKDELFTRRERQSREAKAKELLTKYRDPLLQSANSLQSRCFNIAQGNFLRVYYHHSDRDKKYAINHTLYVIAEYLGWVEVIRREVQFLDLGNVKSTRRLQELLSSIASTFLRDYPPSNLLLFSGEQRAIGELMLIERERGEGASFDCMGFATFSQKLDSGYFSNWFDQLRESIDALANDAIPDYFRLIQLQHNLIDLIDFLDPDRQRIPNNRDKINPKLF